MICTKFGGTCVTPDNLCRLSEVVDDNVGAVVVSAVGKEFFDDTKMTDLLNAYYFSREEIVWKHVEDKIKRLCLVNAIDIDFEKMLYRGKMQIEKHDKDYCLSLGEEFTARCIAKYLGRPYVEAAEYVRFKNGKVDKRETERRIRQLAGQRFVTGGFYGGNDSGRVTFARGGGDVSGAIFAVYTDSVLYENRTDVDGVCVADPHKIPLCRVLQQISYGQMMCLSSHGANVLHPYALELPRKVGLPIVVCGLNEKKSGGTLISSYPCLLPTAAVTSQIKYGFYQTTVIHNMTFCEVAERLADVKQYENDIVKVVLSPQTASIFSKRDVLHTVYDAFVTK